MPRKKRLDISEYFGGIRDGNRVILSQAITLIESTREADRKSSAELIEKCLPYSGNSYRIGITGVPGVGKSTFINKFGLELIDDSHKLAVLAVDPSSPLSHGSILGDKTRMDQLSHHPMAYVRPSPTRGSLGGVARKTREAIILCEAAGFDTIIIETVGVGQSEIAVHSMVDFFLLLVLPQGGDELQGIKKGIMEMAHGIVVHKADGNLLQQARHSQAHYRQALRIFHSDEHWLPPIVLCSSLEDKGMQEVEDMLDRYQSSQKKLGNWEKHRQEQALYWMEEYISISLGELFHKNPGIQRALPELKTKVINREVSPEQAAEKLLNIWKTSE